MPGAKEDCERLLNDLIPFAEKMLKEHGEFYPFAGAMKPDGEVVWYGAKGESDHPASQALLDLLEAALRADAATGAFKATAIFYDARIAPNASAPKTDAIAVMLDHQDRYSVVVFFPYKITDDRDVIVSTPSASPGEGRIFSLAN